MQPARDMQTQSRQPDPTARETLHFEDDPGSGRAKWIAGGLVAGLVLWLGSGFVVPSAREDATNRAEGPQPVAVAVRMSQAAPVTRYFSAEGQAEPDRDTIILAEAGGEVAELLVDVGAELEAGEVIGRVVSTQREAELASAQEELRRAERENRVALELQERGISTIDRVAQAAATLADARSRVTTAELALEDTVIRAPFAGKLELLNINEGELLQTGGEVGRVVDNAPLTVVVQVPQQARARIQRGQEAEVTFITGERAQGRVTFIGSAAEESTRTFRAEIEVDNADRAIPAGISASVRIPTGETEAHFLSPAILSLDTNGVLGIKTVDENNIVAFWPVEIAAASSDGVWLTGLPASAQVITVGQGFVSAGEEVSPQTESGAPDAAAVADDDPALPDPGETSP